MKKSQTDGQIGKKMDRQVCRQTDRQTEGRQIDVQKDSETGMDRQTDKNVWMKNKHTERWRSSK